MKMYSYLISALTAFMAVGTQLGLDRHKMRFNLIQRKFVSNNTKHIHLNDFGVSLRKLRKLNEMKALVANFE